MIENTYANFQPEQRRRRTTATMPDTSTAAADTTAAATTTVAMTTTAEVTTTEDATTTTTTSAATTIEAADAITTEARRVIANLTDLCRKFKKLVTKRCNLRTLEP